MTEQEQFVVQIIETATGEVEKQFGPTYERRAEKIEDGVSINLNHEAFHTEIKPAGDAA